MQNFEQFFAESKGQPMQYKEKNLYLFDKFPVSNGDKLIISIESTNSTRPQGVSIDIEGTCEIQGKLHKKGKGIMPLFWEDSEILDPKHIEITVFTKKNFVWIQNIYEVDYSILLSDASGAPLRVHKKKVGYGQNGAAMIVEEIENGKRYRCSDTASEDKEFPFNNIVFTIQKMKE